MLLLADPSMRGFGHSMTESLCRSSTNSTT